MLQTRTRALDGTLRAKFEQWHPALKPSSENSNGRVIAPHFAVLSLVILKA
jgi:hypothetical protein